MGIGFTSTIDANGWAAIASAVAAFGSLVVALITFIQQAKNNKKSELDKLVDRLIALSAIANQFTIKNPAHKRSFRETADLTYAIDTAAQRIDRTSKKLNLSSDETTELKSYFINYLSYQIVEEMRTNDEPVFEMDASYGLDEYDHIQFIWKRGVKYLMMQHS